MTGTTMTGRCLLVVEDEYYIADELRHVLEKAGAKVLGPVSTVQAALSLLDQTSDLNGVVLDINLMGEMGYPVADALLERGVPFVFATGYDAAAIPTKYHMITRCEKPVAVSRIVTALLI